MRYRRVTYASASIRYGSWFQQSHLKFVVLFLTYDIVRSYEHDREQVAEFEGILQYLRLNGPTSINWPLYVCDEVSIPQRQPVHQVYRLRWNDGLERHTYPKTVMSLHYCPSPRSAHSIQSKRVTCILVACATPRMTFQFIHCAVIDTNR